MSLSYIRLQISGSGVFDEPDNGIDLFPLDWPKTQKARIQEVKIAASDSILQQMGIDKQNAVLRALFIGDWDDKKIKEEALKNLSFHQSNSAYRGRPITVSFMLDDVEQETMDILVGNYRISQRRGRNNIFDVEIQMKEI